MRDFDNGPTGWNDPLGGPEWGWGNNQSPFGNGGSGSGGSGGSGGRGCGCSTFMFFVIAGFLGFVLTIGILICKYLGIL